LITNEAQLNKTQAEIANTSEHNEARIMGS